MQDAVDGKAVQGLEIVLEDQGGPADPAKMRGRSLEEVKPGGLGLHFIHESMDVMEFSRIADRNRILRDEGKLVTVETTVVPPEVAPWRLDARPCGVPAEPQYQGALEQ